MGHFLKLFLTLLILTPGFAQAEMTSTNYHIYADSIGLNGGEFATSTNYSLDSTTNDSPGGLATSTSYTVVGGYQGANLSESLSVNIESASIGLGELSSASVATDSVAIVVETNSITGYLLTVGSVSGSMIASVSDGSVSAGSEEYGIAVTGAHASFGDDRSVIAGRVLASVSDAVLSTTTTLEFKASVASNTTDGEYSQTVTLTASANF